MFEIQKSAKIVHLKILDIYSIYCRGSWVKISLEVARFSLKSGCVIIYSFFTRSGGKVKQGDCRIFYDVTSDHAHVAVVGIGSCDPENANEDIDVRRQNIRSAAAGTPSYKHYIKLEIVFTKSFLSELCILFLYTNAQILHVHMYQYIIKDVYIHVCTAKSCAYLNTVKVKSCSLSTAPPLNVPEMHTIFVYIHESRMMSALSRPVFYYYTDCVVILNGGYIRACTVHLTH